MIKTLYYQYTRYIRKLKLPKSKPIFTRSKPIFTKSKPIFTRSKPFS